MGDVESTGKREGYLSSAWRESETLKNFQVGVRLLCVRLGMGSSFSKEIQSSSLGLGRGLRPLIRDLS